jgi:acyl-CoA thioesterase-1
MKNVKIILISIVVILAILSLVYFTLKEDKEEVNLKQNKQGAGYTIIAFGDSLTAGYGLPLSESYPYQLEEKLKNEGLDVKVINAGVSGETTKGNNERAAFIKDQNPDMVIWGIGGNDALRALPVSEMKSNMESTIKILQSAESKPTILILEMQSPLNAGFIYKQDFDAVYKDLSKKYDLPLVPFLVANVFLNGDLMLADRIHPNKNGYAKLIEDNLLKVVLKEIKK